MKRILRRIRSLLTVAKDSAATDSEKETARSLADSLMAKHGLKESDVPPIIPSSYVFIVVGGFGGFDFTSDQTCSNHWSFTS